MSKYKILIILFINFMLESTIFSKLSINGVMPNVALILIIIVSLTRGRKLGAITGLITGFLRDIAFSSVIGVNAIIYFFVGYIVGIIENKLSRDNLIIPLIIVIISTVFYNFAYAFFMFFLKQNISVKILIKEILIIEIIYNVLVSIPLYKILLDKLSKKGMSFGQK